MQYLLINIDTAIMCRDYIDIAESNRHSAGQFAQEIRDLCMDIHDARYLELHFERRVN